MLSPPVLQPLAICAATWITFRLLQLIFPKDPFKNIPGPPPESWLAGNLVKLIEKDGWDYHERLVKNYGRVFSWTSFFKQRTLYIFDPTALQHIFVKEQHIYEEALPFIQTNLLVFGKGLTSTLGDAHRKQRKILNPVFSSAHMRDMTPTFYDVARKLRDGIKKEVSQGQVTINMLRWMNRAALEAIGRGGFGHSFDNLEPGAEENPVGFAIREVFRGMNTGGIAVVRQTIQHIFFGWGSPRFQRAVMNMLPWPALHQLRDNVDLLHEMSTEIFKNAKRAVEEGKDVAGRIGGGKDIMSTLIRANMAVSDEERLPDDEILGQISTIIVGGTDTTSSALARTLDLLSHHPDVQNQLRQEVVQAHLEHGGELDFNTIMALPYLDAVVRETLRLHAPVPFLQRDVKQDTMLPLSKPIIGIDGREISEIFIPKGVRLTTSQLHCNRDPEIWGPDASEWKPERWLAPLPQSLVDAKVPGVYSHLMTFIAGTRSCVGFRFSQLEMKVVLSTLIQSFKFEPTGQKIMWQNNGITQPTTEDAELDAAGERKLQMPLRVTLV